jgi:hypothetical protein
MNLEEQVCSLELAEHLQELGVKGKGLFSWFHKWEGSSDKDAGKDNVWLTTDKGYNEKWLCYAFTVAELGEMLPEWVECRKTYDKNHWQCEWERHTSSPIFKTAATEADTRAKMLCFLLENQLIPLPVVH